LVTWPKECGKAETASGTRTYRGNGTCNIRVEETTHRAVAYSEGTRRVLGRTQVSAGNLMLWLPTSLVELLTNLVLGLPLSERAVALVGPQSIAQQFFRGRTVAFVFRRECGRTQA